MRGQKYWEEKVPVYTEIKEVRAQRKEQYLAESKKYYDIKQCITNKEYREIVAEILKGNEDARMKLMEISINPIIDAEPKSKKKTQISFPEAKPTPIIAPNIKK